MLAQSRRGTAGVPRRSRADRGPSTYRSAAMLVLVTGGTGFVGAHTVAALTAAGHRVRVLARAPERVAPALAPLSVPADAVEVAAGDVTDETAVDAAVRGVDGLVHAAS